MSKLLKTTLVALILAAALVAFRGPGAGQPKVPAPTNNQLQSNNRQQDRDADTLGREVDIDSARQCIRLFAAIAGRSKLTPREEKLYPNFRRSRENTTGEVFSGKKLIAWLQSTDSLYESQKLSMHINVQMGIYTEEYLKTYHPSDERLRRKMLGRVGIFMIPVDSVTKFSIDSNNKLSPDSDGRGYSKATVSHGPSPDPLNAAPQAVHRAAFFGAGGGKGYDLGGIQP